MGNYFREAGQRESSAQHGCALWGRPFLCFRNHCTKKKREQKSRSYLIVTAAQCRNHG